MGLVSRGQIAQIQDVFQGRTGQGQIGQVGQSAVVREPIIGNDLGQFGNNFPRVLQTFPYSFGTS